MKTICTKCGSDEIYIVQPDQTKIPETQTMDEMVKDMGIMTLQYRPITWACKKCGYSISR